MAPLYYSPAQHRKTRRMLGLLLLILLLAGSLFFLFRVNTFTFTLELEGDGEIILEYGQRYKEAGAFPVLEGTHVWTDGVIPTLIRPKIDGTVDDTALGAYTLTYSARLLGYEAQATRTVRVVDTQCPVIVLTKETGTRKAGEPFREPGYTATDNHDGNITSKVRRIESLGQILYSVVDSSGNPCQVVRAVANFDPEPPEITLSGGEYYVLPLAQPYIEPGYTAFDSGDGDLTGQVMVEGTVDCMVPGTYPITYTVSDSYHNETTVTRQVLVTSRERPQIQWPQEKTIYLTFDDGPGPYTARLLDILDRYEVKATFFVTDSGYDDVMKEIVSRGHSIGIHTASHSYSDIYASPEAYFADLRRIQDKIRENTGVTTTLLRFPGGGSNTVSKEACEGIMTYLTELVQDAGFQYFDWNVDSMDAGGAQTAREVFENVVAGIQAEGTSAVLQHDIHRYSVDAVEDIIRWGQENGYSFAPLTETSPDFHHPVMN